VIDIILIWLAAVGVWPLAHPDHDFNTVTGALDLLIHWSAVAVLVLRWKVSIKRRHVSSYYLRPDSIEDDR